MGEPGSKTRVLIVDDMLTTRENLAKLLFFSNDIEVVGFASNGEELRRQAAKLRPDVVVLTMALPEAESSLLLAELPEEIARSGLILISVEGSAHTFAGPLPANVRALLVKPIAGPALVQAVRHAAGA